MQYKGKKYIVLAQTGDTDLCYEWHEMALLKDEEGQLFFASGSGCSCDYLFDDSFDRTDLVPVRSPHEAVELAKAEFSDDVVYDFASQLFGPGRNGPGSLS